MCEKNIQFFFDFQLFFRVLIFFASFGEGSYVKLFRQTKLVTFQIEKKLETNRTINDFMPNFFTYYQKSSKKNRHKFIYSPIGFKFMLKVDGHVIRKREKLEFSISTTRFFTNFWIFIPERHTNLIFSKSRWRHKEKKKTKNLSSSNFFFSTFRVTRRSQRKFGG